MELTTIKSVINSQESQKLDDIDVTFEQTSGDYMEA